MRRWAGQALGSLADVVGSPRGGGGFVPNPLEEPVARFVAEIGEVLAGLAETVRDAAPTPRAQLARDAALEACNIASAVIDADGRHTDAEMIALAAALGPRLGTSPAPVDGKRAWVDTTSTLFEILVGHDRRDGTRTAWRYYELAMAIAHTVASLDDTPSPSELELIGRFRRLLLGAIEAAPAPQAASPGGPPDPAKATAPPPELPPARPVAELLAELDALVGLAPVKAQVHRVADLLQVMKLRAERGLPTTSASHHLVFTGNPGTGKTTVARLVAQVYRSLGVVEKGHLVETDRSGLVAGYVGQTATKVKAVVEQALGGVLLIDEAYALARGGEGDFGREAIDTLVKLIEDHRDDLVVIVAGYPDEMATFIGANPGLSSRFPTTIFFPDYATDELVAIFEGLCKKGGYVLTADGAALLRARIEATPRTKGFGNGRMVRNAFEAAVARQASRIVDLTETGVDPTDEQLCALEPVDLDDPGRASP